MRELGRFGWIALTGAAMIAGVALQAEHDHDVVTVSDERIEAKIEAFEERMEAIGERIEDGEIDETQAAREIARATRALEGESEEDVQTPSPDAAPAAQEADEQAEALRAQLDKLLEEGDLTDAQHAALVERLADEPEPAQ